MATDPLLIQIFEAFPAPTFLVDGDVLVQLTNRAARELAAVPEGASVPARRGGELLRCVHAEEHPDGCGRAEACKACVIRSSVAEALRTGAVARQHTRVELKAPQGGGVTALEVLVSASPVEVADARLAVLTIEDVTELVELRGRGGGEDDEPVGPPP